MVLPDKLSPSGMEVREEWQADIITAMLGSESDDVLADLDLVNAWGRPISSERVLEGSSRMQRQALFEEADPARGTQPGEVIRHELVMIFLDGEPVGFGECVVLQTFVPEEVRQCRICWCTDTKLLEPCCCRGSSRFICEDCLIRQWEAKEKGRRVRDLTDLKCGICHEPFTGRAAELLGRGLKAVAKESETSDDAELPHVAADRHTAEVVAATALWRQGSYQEAAALFSKAIAGLEIVKGPDSDATLSARHNLGLVLIKQGQVQQAEANIRASKAGFSKRLGPDHPLTLKAAHNEALAAEACGRLCQAATLSAATLDTRRRVLGPDHIDTLKTACNLGLTLLRIGELSRSIAELCAAVAGLERIAGRSHPLTLAAMQNLSLAYSAQKPGCDEALRLAKEASEGRHSTLGPTHPETLEGLRDLSSVLLAAGKNEEAESAGRRALQGMQRAFGFEHPSTRQMLRQLQETYERRGDKEAANALLAEHRASVVVEAAKAPEPRPRGPVVLILLNIYVLPGRRRRGLGRAVMERWKALAKEFSAEAVELCLHATSSSIPFFTEGLDMIKTPCEQGDRCNLRLAL